MKLSQNPSIQERLWVLIPTIFLLSFAFSLTSMAAKKPLHHVELYGEISPGLAMYLKKTFEGIEEHNAGGIVLNIDTYGGRVDSAIKIVELIEGMKPIPVYAYVKDKAWSAGALISLACDNIFMESGSSIGSAAPVTGGGGGASEALGEKHVSAIRTKFRALAEKHGYDPDIAAAMVDKDIEIYRIKTKEGESFMNKTTFDSLSEKEQKKTEILEVVIAEGKLLNLTAEEAKKLNLAEEVYEKREQLFNALQFFGGEVEFHEQGRYEKLIAFLTSGAVSSLLLSLGFLLVYLEFQAPGMSWAGLSGLFCLGLVFGGHYLIEYTEAKELLLFAGGVVLILLELFVIPGFGIAGIGGILCVIAAIYLALVPFDIPRVPWEVKMMKDAMMITLGSMIASIVGGVVVLANIHRIPGLNKLVLTATLENRKGDLKKRQPFVKLSVGATGVAVSSLRPVGKARFGGALYDVVSETGIIQPNTKVEVIDVKGYEYVVREKKDS